MLSNLSKYKIVLASGSPRRKELLAGLGLEFSVFCLKDIDESYPADLNAADVAGYISEKKADAYRQIIHDNELFITADTVVVSGNRILGKPTDRQNAIEMLQALSGKEHQVITGVTLVSAERRASFSVTTDVRFCTLTDEEIEYYVDNYRPFDKAGAYGIQEWIGYIGVENISGSYFNVMGLPVQRLYRELKKW